MELLLSDTKNKLPTPALNTAKVNGNALNFTDKSSHNAISHGNSALIFMLRFLAHKPAPLFLCKNLPSLSQNMNQLNQSVRKMH